MLSPKDNSEILKAGCVVINDKKEILLIFEKTKNSFSFPKGHVESTDESLEQAAQRETLEETGYKVQIIKKLPEIIYSKGNQKIRLNLFQSNVVERVGKTEGDIKMKWVSLDEARKIIYPNLTQVLDNLSL